MPLQKYRKEWEKIAQFKDWLSENKSDNTKAVCKFCKCDLLAKLHDLYRHSKTQKHTRAAEPYSNSRQTKLNYSKQNEVTSKQQAEARFVLFVAAHSSIRNIDHLTNICNKSFADSKSSGFKLHRTKCSQIITNVISHHFVKDLVMDVGNNPFSLIIDESTDVSVTKMLGIVIRYYSSCNNKIVVTFLGLVEISSGTAVDIVAALIKVLDSLKINIKNLQGIGTDNASVMIGSNNSVYQILKREHKLPNLFLTRCVCHSLQLSLSKATENTLPRNIEFLVRETYSWFSHSSNRQNSYKQLYKTMNDDKNPLKIPKMCNTRWISIEPAVNRIISQWSELKLHFDFARSAENCYTAEILHSMYSDNCIKAYLLYLQPILQEVQKCNKLFEGENVDVTKLLENLANLIKSLCTRVLIPSRLSRFDYFNDPIEDKVDPNPYFGYNFESFCRNEKLNINTITDIKIRCKNFIIRLINEIRTRLPSNIQLLNELSILSKDEALKLHDKKSITKLAEQFYSDALLIDKIESQWTNLLCVKWCQTNSTEEFWAEVNLYRDASEENPFSELCELVKAALCLPHSNADVERLFSHMNIVKNKLRNRLHNNTINSLLYIRYGLKKNNKCCDTYEIPDCTLKLIDTNAVYARATTSNDIALNVHDHYDIEMLDLV